MSIVRVTTPCVIEHPLTRRPFTLKPNEPYDTTDPIVREYPWAFRADSERTVEEASAVPGQKRNR